MPNYEQEWEQLNSEDDELDECPRSPREEDERNSDAWSGGFAENH